jgi:hypothetical protein
MMLRHNPPQQIRLFNALTKIKFFEEDFYDVVVKDLVN